MVWLSMLILALQQGAPGVYDTPPGSSGAMATFLLIAVPVVFLVCALLLTYRHTSRSRRNAR